MRIKSIVINKTTITLFCICYIFIFNLFPCVEVFLPNIIRLGLLFISCFFIYIFAVSNGKIRDRVILISLFSFIVNLFLFYGLYKFTYGFITTTYIVLSFFFPMIIGLLVYNMSSDQKTLILDLYIVLETFTSITTIVGLVQNPEASRMLALYDSRYSELYYAMNIGGYIFVYCAVIFFPLLFYKFRYDRKKRFFYLFSLIINSIMIILSQYTIAILLFFVCIALLLYSRNKIISIVMILAMLPVLVIGNDIAITILQWIRGLGFLSNSYSLLTRIDELIVILRYGGLVGDSLGRANVYQMSINAFIQNPISGGLFNPQKLGGHSAIFDYLGATGILGFFFFVLLLHRHLKLITRIYNHTKSYGYIIMSFFIFILISIVNTSFFFLFGIVAYMIPFLVDNSSEVGG